MLSRVYFLAIISILTSTSLKAQDANSLFSKLGVGQPIQPFHATQFGMAGVGLSYGDYRYLNLQNPALLAFNSVYTFSGGMRGENRTIKTEGLSESEGAMNIGYFAMSLPVKPGKWTSAITLSPYSIKNYEFSYERDVIGHPNKAQVTEKGEGNINQLSWSNGFKINKRFYVGAKASLLFSKIETEYNNYVEGADVSVLYAPSIQNRESYSGFVFGTGFAYKEKLSKDLFLNVGGIYDFGKELKTSVLRTFSLTSISSGQQINTDSLVNVNGRTTIPSNWGLGVSINKLDNWSIGIDFRSSQWSEYLSVDNENDNINDSWSLALGGEITPDKGEVDNYLKRINYRFGVIYEKTPYNLENNVVNDFGINFGVSLPAGISSIDIGAQIGKRGDLNKHLFHENYFKFMLGITFNDQRWFEKRKFD